MGELAQLKFEKKQGGAKSASLMASSQGNMLVKKLVTVWREWISEAKQDRIIETLKEENLHMKMQFEREKVDSAVKAVSALSGKNAGMMVKEIVALWRDFLIYDKKNIELEKLR